MKFSRILPILLWGLALLLIVRTCAGPDEGATASLFAERAETFDSLAPAEERFFVLENERLWTRWSTRGGACVQVKLKDYSARLAAVPPFAEDDWLVLYNAPAARPPEPGAAAGQVNYRRRDGLRLWEPKGELGIDLDVAEWRLGEIRPAGDRGQEVVLELDTPVGIRLAKRLRLDSGARHIALEFRAEPTAEIAGAATGYLHFRVATGGGMTVERDSFYPNPYAAAGRFVEGEIDEMEVFNPRGKLPANRAAAASWNGDFAFVLEGSKYFLSAIRPRDRNFQGAVAEVLMDKDLHEQAILAAFPQEERARARAVLAALVRLGLGAPPAEVAAASGDTEAFAVLVRGRYEMRARELAASGYDGTWKRTSIAGDFEIHVGAAGAAAETRSFEWYLGPKDPAAFRGDYAPLEAVIEHVDYGGSFFYRVFFTEFIAPLILGLLELLHGLVANWGVAIILMTLLVRAALFPLNRHSQVKMAAYQAKMARIKPQQDAINQKYAKDPARRQQETMKLHREHKLSPPLGGCLPVLLQFPIFIGLFAALRCSVLLRQQPFAFWIQDLSRPDALIDFGRPVLDFFPFAGVTTLNVLPIVMVLLWVLHQRSMPKPTDPQQAQMQKMMTFMPVLFGVMLYNYAAGLSLYMITSSLLGIFEQTVIKKRWPVPVPAGAAARR